LLALAMERWSLRRAPPWTRELLWSLVLLRLFLPAQWTAVPGVAGVASVLPSEFELDGWLVVLVVISLNGGWTGDPKKERPGRDLGYTRFDLIAEALGGHGEYVEAPEDIRPALERAMAAVRAGRPALVNVVTDWRARASTAEFTRYVT
jgi:hypothetical protein